MVRHVFHSETNKYSIEQTMEKQDLKMTLRILINEYKLLCEIVLGNMVRGINNLKYRIK